MARVKWWITRGLMLGVILVAVYGVQRFDLEVVPADCDSMTPSWPTGGGQIVVDRYYRHARALVRMDILWYEGELDGRRTRLMGRVRAVPGDRLGRRDKILTINGRLTAFPAMQLPEGQVPAGYYLILNENRDSRLPDGRMFGLIPEEQLLGRVITMFPSAGGNLPSR